MSGSRPCHGTFPHGECSMARARPGWHPCRTRDGRHRQRLPGQGCRQEHAPHGHGGAGVLSAATYRLGGNCPNCRKSCCPPTADRRCRPLTKILTPGQHGDCPQFIPLMGQVRITRRARAGPALAPALQWATRLTLPPPTAPTSGNAASPPSSRSRRTKNSTAGGPGSTGGRPPAFDRNATRTAIPSSAASPSSSSSALWPPASTTRTHLPRHHRRRLNSHLAPRPRPMIHRTGSR
jgi:hypothetical protein